MFIRDSISTCLASLARLKNQQPRAMVDSAPARGSVFKGGRKAPGGRGGVPVPPLLSTPPPPPLWLFKCLLYNPRNTERYLAGQEDTGGCQEERIDGVERVHGVESLEEDGGAGYHLLPQLQLLTQHLIIITKTTRRDSLVRKVSRRNRLSVPIISDLFPQVLQTNVMYEICNYFLSKINNTFTFLRNDCFFHDVFS